MNENRHKCISDEYINISRNDDGNRVKNNSNYNNTKRSNKQNSKKVNKNNKNMQRKKQHSNLNFKLSFFLFIAVSILALFVILNKGKFGKISLVHVNDSLHTAELECDSDYLSMEDNEKTTISLTIDGVKRDDGYVLRSSNSDIAKIENNQVVAGSKEGTATITAYYEEYDMNISTEVVSYIPINTITATLNSAKINVGAETEISINIVPKNGTDDYITYKSSDDSVATVSNSGLITGITPGTATITIEDELTGASATKTITVK